MVERDVIYEEILVKQRQHQKVHERSRSLPAVRSSYKPVENRMTSVYVDGGTTVYVKMSSADNVMNTDDDKLYNNVLPRKDLYADMLQRRGSICSCSSSSVESYKPTSARSAEEIGSVRRLRFEEEDKEESIYAEIVTSNKNTEISTARITRESNNPILRQVLTADSTLLVKRACSLNNLVEQARDGGTCTTYGVIDHRFNNRTGHATDRKKRPHSFYIRKKRYSNAAASPTGSYIDELYENTHQVVPSSRDCSSSLDNVEEKESLDENEKHKRHGSNNSYYENIDQKIEKYYENVSDGDCDVIRERRHSKPIDIIQALLPNRLHDEVLYSDIDFNRKSHPPFSYSSSSVTSSPRGSVCSSMSSEHSIFASTSTSPPPPIPNITRKRMERYASWGNVNAFTGLNYYAAHYLGRNVTCKVTSDSIEQAVCHVAQNTNVLEMKPVLAEISHECIRFGSNSSPWELIVSFPIEEVIGFEVVLKNAYFLGIVAGKPGEDAYCYVLQSDKSSEIGDAIQGIFETVNKIPRSQSSYEWIPSIEPEFHRFHFLIKVGFIKVKKSFHNVNDYIKLILEKVNPKEFRSVNLELLGQNIIVSEAATEEEDSHSIPSILTLGVYQCDKRYFGYIISEICSTSRTKVLCYVYRAARNETAAKIIETISQSCQNSYTPRASCDINPIYSGHKTSSVSSRQSISSTTGASSLLSECSSSIIKRQFSTNEEVVNLHGSTETLLTITPSPSCDKLPRSSTVTSEQRRVSTEMGRCMPIVENPIYQKTSAFSGDNANIGNPAHTGKVIFENSDGTKKLDPPKKQKHKRILGKFRHTIKHKTSHDARPPAPIIDVNELQTETFNVEASYVCSTVINPPLKQKHVKECYKQYSKEMNRAGKMNGNNTKVNGNLVNLQITTNIGVSMLDPHQHETVVRHFPIDVFEMFSQHPEDTCCFAFSTALPGNNKHKCHLFCAKKEVITGIAQAFEKLTIVKKALSL